MNVESHWPLEALLTLLVNTIPGVAFVVRRRGVEVVVEHSNAEAHAALGYGSEYVLGAVASAVQGTSSSFAVAPLGDERFLVVRAPPGRLTADDRLRDLARANPNKWALTRRRREVTLAMVQGGSNRSIAEELGLRENTIELHVSAILRQTGADSRTQLVAWFWTEETGRPGFTRPGPSLSRANVPVTDQEAPHRHEGDRALVLGDALLAV